MIDCVACSREPVAVGGVRICEHDDVERAHGMRALDPLEPAQNRTVTKETPPMLLGSIVVDIDPAQRQDAIRFAELWLRILNAGGPVRVTLERLTPETEPG